MKGWFKTMTRNDEIPAVEAFVSSKFFIATRTDNKTAREWAIKNIQSITGTTGRRYPYSAYEDGRNNAPVLVLVGNPQDITNLMKKLDDTIEQDADKLRQEWHDETSKKVSQAFKDGKSAFVKQVLGMLYRLPQNPELTALIEQISNVE